MFQIGVGKDTIINALRERFDDTFGLSVSHTTRKPRDGEKDGVHYHFVDHERFESKEDFMEITEYAGNKYGTSYKAVQEVANNGLICIMNVHYSAAQKIENQRPGWCHFIFITVSGKVSTLRKRLEHRGESNDSINKRLQKAQEEFDFVDNHSGFFDVVLSNDGDIEHAVDALANILSAWYPHFKTKLVDQEMGSNALGTLRRRKVPDCFALEFVRNHCIFQSLFCCNFGAAWYLLCDEKGSICSSLWLLPRRKVPTPIPRKESLWNPELDTFSVNIQSSFDDIEYVDPETTPKMGGYHGTHFGFNNFKRSSPLSGYGPALSSLKHEGGERFMNIHGTDH